MNDGRQCFARSASGRCFRRPGEDGGCPSWLRCLPGSVTEALTRPWRKKRSGTYPACTQVSGAAKNLAHPGNARTPSCCATASATPRGADGRRAQPGGPRQRFDDPGMQFTYVAPVEQVELLAAHLKRKRLMIPSGRFPRRPNHVQSSFTSLSVLRGRLAAQDWRPKIAPYQPRDIIRIMFNGD